MHLLEIGDATLCEERRELRRGGALVPVQPKVLDVLLYLVQHRHRVVPQPELLRGVWRDTVVTGASLARALKEARRALGDDGRGQRWIRTLPGRGYRFVGPVAEKTETPVPGGAPDFIGREPLLAALERALDAAARGQGGVVSIEGPAGIGKTRTAEELMRRAQLRGARVAWSWCAGAQGAPPLWPWTRLLAGLGEAERGLLPRGLPPQGGSGAPVAGTERFQLFAAIADRVVRAAARGLVVLAIDDLQEADAGSVAMLEFLAHELPHRPVLVIATLRPDVAERRPDLERERARLMRHGCMSRHAVDGLDADELTRLVASRIGAEPPPAVVAALLASTHGNPFLALEILRAGAPSHSLGDAPAWEEIVPRGLAQLLHDRLARLAPETREVLRCAALLGEALDESLLDAVVPAEHAGRLPAAIGEAVRDEVLAFGSDGRPRFAHALFREALLAQLAPAERGALHRRAASALEGRADAARHDGAIARHWHAAGAHGDASRALEWSLRAAESAVEAFAWEGAAQHLAHAQELVDGGAPCAAEVHCELLLRLAEVRGRLGEREAARDAAERAHVLAVAHGWPERVARAALAIAGPPYQYRLPDAALSGRLEAAFEGLRAEHAALAARVLARRAAEHVLDADRARVARLRGAAVDAALSCGDAEVLAEVLMTPYSGIWEGIEPGRRLALADACVARGRAQANANAEGRGAILRLSELIGRGELERFDAEVSVAEAFTLERHEPAGRYQVLLHRATRALAAGELRACEALAEEAFALGQRIRIAGAAELFATQITVLRREQGRLEELLAANTTLYRHHPSPSARILHAWGVAEIGGHEEEARARFAEALDADVTSLPLQATGVANAALLARAAFLLRDARPAAALRAVLAPHRDRVVLRGTVTAHGPGAYFLALLAWLEGRDAEVQPLFEEALERTRAMRAALWRGHVELDLACWLASRGGAGARDRARRLAVRVARSAASIGARSLARSAEALLGGAGAAPA